jgi:arylsulfatase
VPAGKVENQLRSGLDWFPTFVAAAGNPNIGEELKKGKQIGDRTYKVHLDGYDQTDLITGKGKSKRNEVYYFTEGTLGAVRIGDYKYRLIDQPNGWFGGTVKLDWPILVNIRLDPFERTGLQQSLFAKDWWAFQFWRFVFLQQEVGKAAQTFFDFPPMQKGGSFNLQAIKEELDKKMASQAAQ